MKSVFRIRNLALLAFVSTGLLTTPLQAGTVPQNLGYGLDKLVESHVTLKAQNAARKPGEPQIVGQYNGWTTEVAAGYAADAISEAGTGRFIVDITLRGTVPVDQVQAQIERRFPNFTVTAVDTTYRGVGIIEGYARIADVAALSQMKGVRAVMLGLRPSVDRAAIPAETRPGAVLPEPTNGQVFTRLGTALTKASSSIGLTRSARFTIRAPRRTSPATASPSVRSRTATTPAPLATMPARMWRLSICRALPPIR